MSRDVSNVARCSTGRSVAWDMAQSVSVVKIVPCN
jgi:hypothetical protein